MTRSKDMARRTGKFDRLLINRTISIVMLLISFLTFWSLAISSIEQRDKAHYFAQAASSPDFGLERLMSRN